MENRRNYYRILHVQPDAPLAVVKMSYRTLMQKLKAHPDLGGDVVNASLLNEAYNVISDPIKRALYDKEFHIDTGRKTTESSSEVTAEPSSESPPESPPSSSFESAAKPSPSSDTESKSPPPQQVMGRKSAVRCIFCNALQTGAYSQRMVDLAPNHQCINCNSPLQQLNHLNLEESCKRAIHRVDREGSINFFTQWPQTTPHQGVITDLSPNGLGFKSDVAIQHDAFIKIDSIILKALVRIINCRQLEVETVQQFQCGGQFLTLEFSGLQGNFVSKRI